MIWWDWKNFYLEIIENATDKDAVIDIWNALKNAKKGKIKSPVKIAA